MKSYNVNNSVFLIEYMELTLFMALPPNEEESEEPQADLPLEVYEDPMDPQVWVHDCSHTLMSPIA